jgi:hypothetical protein
MTQATTTYQAGQQITFEQKYADGIHEHEGIIENVYDANTIKVAAFEGQGIFLINANQIKATHTGIEVWRHSEGLVAFAC